MNVTVLLADTGDVQRMALEEPLRERNISLVTVANGTEALLMLKDVNPQVLLTNVVLPGVDGYSLCEMVKNDIELAQMRVLLLNDADVDVDLMRANAASSDGILQKPFSAETLVTYLDSFGLLEEGGGVFSADAEPVFAMESEPLAGDFAGMAEESPAESPGFEVSDEASFADVAPAEPEPEEEAFPVEISADAPGETMVLGDETEPEPVDLSVSGESISLSAGDPGEPMEVSLMEGIGEEESGFVLENDETEESVPVAAAAVEPFDLGESAGQDERDTLLAGPVQELPESAPVGSVSEDLARAEGKRLVEEIVRRLSDDVIREVAWEVVPELAERMIREALQKITR